MGTDVEMMKDAESTWQGHPSVQGKGGHSIIAIWWPSDRSWSSCRLIFNGSEYFIYSWRKAEGGRWKWEGGSGMVAYFICNQIERRNSNRTKVIIHTEDEVQ